MMKSENFGRAPRTTGSAPTPPFSPGGFRAQRAVGRNRFYLADFGFCCKDQLYQLQRYIETDLRENFNERMYPCTYVNFPYCIIKAETSGVMLQLSQKQNRHAGKMVVPFTGCAQQSRSESSYSAESVLSTNLLSLAQQAFCPVHSFLVLFKELDSEQLRKREGHLKPDTGRRRAEPPPAPVPRECPVGELSAEA